MSNCMFEECEHPEHRAGLCRGHYGQRERGEKPSPLKKQLSGMARLEDAALSYADADSDEEYKLAKDRLRKSAQAMTGRSSFSEAIQAGLAAARARGVRLGRPATVDERQAKDLAAVFGVRKAARMLGVSPFAVFRAKRRST